ncbi:MAG: STAS domain-containing protein [Candidatus Aminicenantes bacterium]|nr:STAS domain-containing protein [Candidatus Aminicenantes bacterium]
MNLKIKNDKEKSIVFLSGNIDIQAAEILKKNLFRIYENDKKKIVLDFKEVHSIGSSGIGALIFFHKRFLELEGKIQIINVNREIRSLFGIIKLDDLFEISETALP